MSDQPIVARRRQIKAALDRQPVNGIGIRTPRGIIFRPTPSLWKVITPGAPATTDRHFHRQYDVMDYVTREEASDEVAH